MCECVCVWCASVCVWQGSALRVSDPLELALQEIVSSMMVMLGTEFCSSARGGRRSSPCQARQNDSKAMHGQSYPQTVSILKGP